MVMKYRIEIKTIKKIRINTKFRKRTLTIYPKIVSFNIETKRSLKELKNRITNFCT